MIAPVSGRGLFAGVPEGDGEICCIGEAEAEGNFFQGQIRFDQPALRTLDL